MPTALHQPLSAHAHGAAHPTSPTPEALLAGSPLPEVRRLVVDATDDFVTLTGVVSTYYLKQIAQETVRSGVRNRRLVNRVVVASGR